MSESQETSWTHARQAAIDRHSEYLGYSRQPALENERLARDQGRGERPIHHGYNSSFGPLPESYFGMQTQDAWGATVGGTGNILSRQDDGPFHPPLQPSHMGAMGPARPPHGANFHPPQQFPSRLQQPTEQRPSLPWSWHTDRERQRADEEMAAMALKTHATYRSMLGENEYPRHLTAPREERAGMRRSDRGNSPSFYQEDHGGAMPSQQQRHGMQHLFRFIRECRRFMNLLVHS